mgnify:CR=1 FL=1
MSGRCREVQQHACCGVTHCPNAACGRNQIPVMEGRAAVASYVFVPAGHRITNAKYGNHGAPTTATTERGPPTDIQHGRSRSLENTLAKRAEVPLHAAAVLASLLATCRPKIATGAALD